MTPEPKKEAPKEEPNPWKEYERRKGEIPNDLNPQEYMAACERIAQELGI